MGASVALKAAQTLNCAGVILESALSDYKAGTTPNILLDNNMDLLKKVDSPTILLSPMKDLEVPYKHCLNLQTALK